MHVDQGITGQTTITPVSTTVRTNIKNVGFCIKEKEEKRNYEEKREELSDAIGIIRTVVYQYHNRK